MKHEIEVTCEVVHRQSFRKVVDDEEYEKLLDGDTAPIEDLFDKTEQAEVADSDYTVYDLDTDKQVVDWR